jgi:sugar O-acyltransferase (sialic acid O-acetyltransferase NeuD family)
VIRVLILGAGGHAQVVADILMRSHESGIPIIPIGYLDDNASLHGSKPLGLPVLGGLDQRKHIPHDALIVAIGDNIIREKVTKKLKQRNEQLVTARHPSAVIAPNVSIGAGTMICASVVVNTDSVIGSGVILNTGCTLDHHNQVSNFAHIAPGVHTGGNVQVGEGTFVGIGTTIKPGCKVGKWSVLGVGTVVINDIPDYVTVVGVPGKVIKHLNNK